MALFLNESEVASLLPMTECIDVLDQAFAHAGAGDTEIKPRSRMRMPNGFFHLMAAADAGSGVFGYKAYPSFAGSGEGRIGLVAEDPGAGVGRRHEMKKSVGHPHPGPGFDLGVPGAGMGESLVQHVDALIHRQQTCHFRFVQKQGHSILLTLIGLVFPRADFKAGARFSR